MAKPKIKHTITKKEWDKKHKDFKLMGKDGIPYIMTYDSKIGTHLVPVKIVKEEMDESVGAELDLIKQSSKDVKDFIKKVFRDSDFRAMKNDKDFVKYLKSMYEGIEPVVNEGKKRFYQQDRVGSAKYTISYHDGKQKHKDGSDFYGIQIFRNKKDLEKFRTELLKKGYREDSGFKKESVNEAPTKRSNDFFNDSKHGKAIYKLLGGNPFKAGKVKKYLDTLLDKLGDQKGIRVWDFIGKDVGLDVRKYGSQPVRKYEFALIGAIDDLYYTHIKESVNEAKEPEVITQLRKIVKDKQNSLVVDTKSKKKVRVDMNSANLMVQVYDKLRKQSNKDKFVKSGIVAMGHMAYKLMRNESVNESIFSFKTDNIEQLHFETNPKKAELMKIELGKSQGEINKRKQIESGEYSLRLFRKKIKYGNGKDVGVFLPGSYDAVTSKLGDGPHKKAVKKVKWTQKKYDQWLEDMASNGGARNAFDMAQNAKNEPGLIDWVKKNFRGDKPLQRIQWDIEGFNESVNEAYVVLHSPKKGVKPVATAAYADKKDAEKWAKDLGGITMIVKKKMKGIDEAKGDLQIYHKSYTLAIEEAKRYAYLKGYTIADDELFTKVGLNSKRPSVGKTTRVSLELLKKDKPQRKMLHIQVYGMKNMYELNAYIN